MARDGPFGFAEGTAMYRWMLCFRYLRTRYIALASIVSVTLGVATLIIVNSVMAGFAAEMHERLHGLASDILIECHASGGLPDPDANLAEIRKVLGNRLEGSSVSVHVPGILGIEFNGQLITRHVNLVGIDAETYDDVSQFGRFLLHPSNQTQVDFNLKETGYAPDREQFPESGWGYRREKVAYDRALQQERDRVQSALRRARGEVPVNDEASEAPKMSIDLSSSMFTDGGATGSKANGTDAGAAKRFDESVEQFPGIVLGISTCSARLRDEEGKVRDHYYCRPGDDVRMMFPNASDNTKVVNQKFTVVDLYESGMSEYDSTFAFVRLDQLQDFRGMIDPATGVRSVTAIQLKLVEGADLNVARDDLRRRFPPDQYALNIQTWRDMQGPLLAAVRLETTILNILLFLIIAVAGFGILATFFMIVVEKTRDIGTLKALGASSSGVMSIFLSYGVLLGIVGSGVGMVGGLIFIKYINSIAALIEQVTGQEVFDPTVYYFNSIPTIVDPWTIAWVVAGSVAIATMASVLPSLRAARMHPVRALRFE
jgi:lipoprotein-releasing system permease protein